MTRPPPEPVSRRLDSIEAEPITWLWDRRIPAREVTLIAGEGGLGKTSLVTDIAARLSVGRRLPGDDARREPMTIGFMSLEDDPGRVVRPRFALAAGDPTRFHVFDGFRTRTGTRVAELPADTEGIGGWCQAIGAGLLVIDSWTAYATALDHHKGAEVRRVLGPLSELCHRAELTVLLIGHVNKATATRGAARVSGSADIVNAARSVYLVGRAPGEDPELRVLCPAKMNYCKPARALSFALEDCGQVARVDWRGEIDLHADDLEPAHRPRESGAAREAAESWLHQELIGGEVPVRDLRESAEAEGHSWTTVKRAMAELGVAKRKAGSDGRWFAALPPTINRASPLNGGPLGPLGSLGGDHGF